jgi:hypothetical protein
MIGKMSEPRQFVAEAFSLHPIAVRLPLSFDPLPLAQDLSRIPETWWQKHLGPYHDGNWEAVSLWAPGGDRAQQRSRGGTFAPTDALLQSPALQQTIEALPGTRNRIRLMRLRPGGEIFRHSDPMSDIDPTLVRLHIPIVTNPDVDFRVNDQRIVMSPGELWNIDVRFPHQVRNGGETVRVHLVADLLRSDALDELLAGGTSMGEGRLTGYFARHLIPRRIRVRLGLGN